MNNNNNIEEWLKKFPYLRIASKYTLFTSKEELKDIKKSEKIKVGLEEISILFLNKLLEDDNYFQYAYHFFNKDIDNFIVTYIINGDMGESIHYKKSSIIKGIEELINKSQLTLDEEKKKKYYTLKSLITYDKFIENYQNENYNIEIDYKKYSIPIMQLIEFMNLNDNDFDKICSNKDVKEIHNIPKDHFVLAALKYF